MYNVRAKHNQEIVMKRVNKAKKLVMQTQFRTRVVRDRSKYTRNTKHKKAPAHGGFVVLATG